MEGRKGFTILELLLTVLVISVLASVAIPTFFLRADVTLENASVLLARDLRAAQNRSAYMAEASRFVFRADGDGYYVTNHEGRTVPNPRTLNPFERVYSSDGVFQGVRITEIRAGSDRSIAYDDHGRSTERASLTLSYNGDTRMLRVEKGSGDITILGSTSGWEDVGY